MNRYLDMMEKTLRAYSREHIVRYYEECQRDGITEHGFPRLISNIGILIANGRCADLEDIFYPMMDFCCADMVKRKSNNEFTIKEIIFAILELEQSGKVAPERIQAWKECFRTVPCEVCYKRYAATPEDNVHNWALFCAVSEFMRDYIGLANTREFVDLQILTQLRLFDENGMYRDPNEPMVYDLVSRGLFAVLLYFGYDGKYKDEMDDLLRRAGLLTLKMQSVSGEIPYGGRSAQFLHNEAQLAAVLSYEALRYEREGKPELAAKFRRALDGALSNMEFWLSKTPVRHIKNRFPIVEGAYNAGYGCEDYAYFDKYMITASSFTYVAYMFTRAAKNADTAVPSEHEQECYVAQTSHHFHKVFLRRADTFLEFDTNADPHYDCSGLGRIHFQGVPSPLALSVPCAHHPNYGIGGATDAIDLAYAAGIKCADGRYHFATDAKHTLLSHESTEHSVRLTLQADLYTTATATPTASDVTTPTANAATASNPTTATASTATPSTTTPTANAAVATASDVTTPTANDATTAAPNATIHHPLTMHAVAKEDAVELTVEGNGEVALLLPVFFFDGEQYTRIRHDGTSVHVHYEGYTLTLDSDTEILSYDGGKGYNRNGVYLPYLAAGQGSVTVRIRCRKDRFFFQF